jgi:hypothetical protein
LYEISYKIPFSNAAAGLFYMKFHTKPPSGTPNPAFLHEISHKTAFQRVPIPNPGTPPACQRGVGVPGMLPESRVHQAKFPHKMKNARHSGRCSPGTNRMRLVGIRLRLRRSGPRADNPFAPSGRPRLKRSDP